MSNSKTIFDFAHGNSLVFLIEDDGMLRFELANTLRAAGLHVNAFATAEAFLASVDINHAPAVIIADMTLPGLSGIHMYEQLRSKGVDTPLLFISGFSEPHQIIEGMKLGAVDFLWKPFKAEALFKSVLKGLMLDSERLNAIDAFGKIMPHWNSLTDREQDICRLMLLGHGNTEIAAQVGIKPDTANKHRMKILKKLGVDGKAGLMALLKDFAPARLQSKKTD